MAAREQPDVAFVLAGGASLGAIQVGMLRALYERGIAPEVIVGTSAGGLRGAFIASRPQTVATADALMDGGVANNTPISHAGRRPPDRPAAALPAEHPADRLRPPGRADRPGASTTRGSSWTSGDEERPAIRMHMHRHRME